MAEQVLLSIIIPAYNGTDYIIRLLSRIEYYNSPDEFHYEVLLVNDGSSDNSVKIITLYNILQSG